MTLFFWKSYIGHQTAAAVYPNISRHLYLAVSQSVNQKKKRRKERKTKTNLFSCPSLFQPIHVLGQNSLFYVAEKFSKCSMVTKYLALICHRYYHDRG